jgi:hypothetical protein
MHDTLVHQYIYPKHKGLPRLHTRARGQASLQHLPRASRPSEMIHKGTPSSSNADRAASRPPRHISKPPRSSPTPPLPSPVPPPPPADRRRPLSLCRASLSAPCATPSASSVVSISALATLARPPCPTRASVLCLAPGGPTSPGAAAGSSAASHKPPDHWHTTWRQSADASFWLSLPHEFATPCGLSHPNASRMLP